MRVNKEVFDSEISGLVMAIFARNISEVYLSLQRLHRLFQGASFEASILIESVLSQVSSQKDIIYFVDCLRLIKNRIL